MTCSRRPPCKAAARPWWCAWKDGSTPRARRGCSSIAWRRAAASGHLVLNLSAVTFLSSSGVGVLLVMAEKARGDGGSLRLASPSAAVRAPLELLNLHRFLTIDGSEDDAMSALGA